MPEPDDFDWSSLILAAIAIRNRAYAPYSRFAVGAAVQTAGGHVFAGCNVENASYGLSLCAERSAIVQAVSGGHRDLVAIAVAASPLATPCGACRQFIAEFGQQIRVAAVDPAAPGNVRHWSIGDLLPECFQFGFHHGHQC
jgi:cytidine deaminase